MYTHQVIRTCTVCIFWMYSFIPHVCHLLLYILLCLYYKYYNMSQQSISEFDILEGGGVNGTVKNATQLNITINYDIDECDGDDFNIFPCT